MAKKNFHKIVKSKGFKLAIGLSAAVLAIGATCGLAIGLSATSKTTYININPFAQETSNRVPYATEGVTKDCTTWNVEGQEEPLVATPIMRGIGTCFAKFNYNKQADQQFNYVELVGNGPDTSVLDKSFQQSAYYAQTYWAHAYDKGFPNGEGTQWIFSTPQFDYEKYPLDSLVLTNSNTITPGQMSSSAQKPSGASNTDFVNTYKAAHNINKQALVLPGYQHITPLSILKQNDPDVYHSMGYILVDSEVSDPNIASMQFKAEQSAFLSGIATCQFLEENWEDVYSKVNDGQLSVGCFGGQNIITVTCFMGGLELGVWFYNNYILPNTDFYKNANEQEREKRTIKFISLGKISSYFSGTFVIGDAKLLAQELLARGASAIMAVAGPQTGDVVSEIVAQRSPCRVIGVDSAMENGDWGKYYSTSNLFKEKTKVVLCSAEKNVAQLTAQILDNMWCRNCATFPEETEEGTKYNDIDKSCLLLFYPRGGTPTGNVTYTVKYGTDEATAKQVPAEQIDSGAGWTITPDSVPNPDDYIWITGTDESGNTWNTKFQNGPATEIPKEQGVPGTEGSGTIHCEVISINPKHLHMTEINDSGKLNFALAPGIRLDGLTDEKQRMGAIGTVGYTSIGNLYNGGVNLSTAGQEYLVRALSQIDKNGDWSKITSYNEAIETIIEKDVPAITALDGTQLDKMNVLDFINSHRYFKY